MGTPGQGGFVWLNCLIEDGYRVFRVNVGLDDVVDGVKKAIQSERALSILENVDPYTLELWKPKDPIAAQPGKTLAARIGSLEGGLSEFAVILETTDHVFNIFFNVASRG
ncbi:hypothetical protein F5887DRAFT_978892 [Amanita rubescens]|nr:hypothetical protein F5887DRAFT_978892 [Amanita rubescens]